MQAIESQAYLDGLENGTIEIPTDASVLELKAAEKIKALNKKFSELQIRREAISQEINTVAGQMTAYAELLIIAESGRRKALEER